MNKINKLGDFSGLATDYSNNRPDYSKSVAKCLMSILPKPIEEIDFVDVGAGTGIWTRMVLNEGVKSVIAVEPNSDMLKAGQNDSKNTKINWIKGSAEKINLPSGSVDFLTMASSFHWADFDIATQEFDRLLRPEGRFAALWNPRLIEVNPILVEIENYLSKLNPSIKRISSGRSGITDQIEDKLWKSKFFDDVIFVEGRHVIKMSQERYLGAWRSVNDLRVQLGPKDFDKFLNFVESKIEKLEFIEATYLTRAWSARKKS